MRESTRELGKALASMRGARDWAYNGRFRLLMPDERRENYSLAQARRLTGIPAPKRAPRLERAPVGEMASAIRMLSRGLPTGIMRLDHPCEWQGKYVVVGGIPASMYRHAYDTEAEVVGLLLAAGITRFQLSDLRFYSEEMGGV